MHEKVDIMGVPSDFGGDANIQKVERNMDYGEKLQRIVDPNHYLEQISHEIEEDGVYPIFYSNHNQHLNIAGMHKVVEALPARPNDMYVAVAWSLLNDGQDKKIVNFAKGLIPFLEKDDVHLVPVARPIDISDLRNDKKHQEAKFALRATRGNIQLLENSLSQSAGLILFPGATTAEAVKNENGKRPGMGRVTGNFMFDIAQKAEKVGRKVLWVPVGMVDTNRIVEPRQSNPHARAKFEIAKDMVVGHLGLDINPIRPIAKIVMGEPFSVDGVSQFEGSEFNDYMMLKVANLLPSEARGYYGSSETIPEELKAGRVRFLGIEY